jgi:hypothetical protein
MAGSKGFASLVALVVVAPLGIGLAAAAPMDPGVLIHMEHARESLREGHLSRALAHANVVLMDGPVYVWIDTSGAVPADRRAYEAACDEAIWLWENALGGSLLFLHTSRREDAQVTIEFCDSLRYENKPVAGFIRWLRRVEYHGPDDARHSYRADIRLRTRTSWGARLSPEAVRHAAGHELGHLLGLGDTDERGRIMSAIDPHRPVAAPSSDEIRALLELREEAAQLRQESILRAALPHLPRVLFASCG